MLECWNGAPILHSGGNQSFHHSNSPTFQSGAAAERRGALPRVSRRGAGCGDGTDRHSGGGAVYLVDYGDLDRTDINGNTIARIAPRNFEFLASYATNLTGSFVFGISYKLVQFRVDCSGDCRDFPAGTGATHALDLGGQFSVGPGGPLRIGVAVRNIGFRLQVQNQAQADALPTRLAVGALYEVRLRPATGRALDQAFDLKLAADVDSPWGQAGQSETRVGLDIGYQRLVRVRAGYAFVQDGLSGPSVGLGLESGSLGVDLARAFLTGSDLQDESPTFFSLRVSFA